jgi:hypothetical protein
MKVSLVLLLMFVLVSQCCAWRDDVLDKLYSENLMLQSINESLMRVKITKENINELNRLMYKLTYFKGLAIANCPDSVWYRIFSEPYWESYYFYRMEFYTAYFILKKLGNEKRLIFLARRIAQSHARFDEDTIELIMIRYELAKNIVAQFDEEGKEGK